MKKLLLPLLAFMSTLFLNAQTVSPIMSANSGFYENDFTLTISHPDSDAVIIYTLDGSEPHLDNIGGVFYNYKNSYIETPGDQDGTLLQGSFQTLIYETPLLIEDRSNEPDNIAAISTTFQNQRYFPDTPVFKGTTVRARAIIGTEYSPIVTKNYYVTPQGEDRYTLPILSLNINPDKLYSYEYGLNVAGLMFDQWRVDNPGEVAGQWASSNYWMSGSSSELEFNFSYIENGVEVLNHNVGLRNHGNGSRYMPNRSIRLYAKNGYGVSKFNHSFFDDYDHNSFKRIILRNSGNDASKTMFRDAFTQQLVKHLNVEIQDYQPVVVFINSEYQGIYNIRERFDEHYFDRVFGVDEDEIDYLENTGLENGVVDLGDDVHYLSMMNFLESNSLEDTNNYDYVITLLDPIDYTDYCISYIFTSNYDWPHNNNEYWRKRVSYSPEAPYGQDGRWRWLIKDMDYSYGLWDWDDGTHNTLNFATTLYEETSLDPEVFDKSTLILRRLLENETYKNYFVNRFADLINTTFLPSRTINLIDQMQSVLAPEIGEHIHRWGMIPSHSVWNSNVDVMRDFAQSRPTIQRNHIAQRFNIDSHEVIVDVSTQEHGYVKINTIEILPTTVGVSETPYPWEGVYFENIPITITAIPNGGYVFSHWEGAYPGTNSEQVISLTEDIYIKAVFIHEDGSSVDDQEVSKVKVYPNPFENKIHVISENYDFEYSIFTLDGKLVRSGVMFDSTLYVDELQTGMYFLKLKTLNKEATYKIFKK